MGSGNTIVSAEQMAAATSNGGPIAIGEGAAVTAVPQLSLSTLNLLAELLSQVILRPSADLMARAQRIEQARVELLAAIEAQTKAPTAVPPVAARP